MSRIGDLAGSGPGLNGAQALRCPPMVATRASHKARERAGGPLSRWSAFHGTAGLEPIPYRLFAGRRIDAKTGLSYNRARNYSPALGRFLQTDPAGTEGGINLYAYAGNDPADIADPSGKWGEMKSQTRLIGSDLRRDPFGTALGIADAVFASTGYSGFAQGVGSIGNGLQFASSRIGSWFSSWDGSRGGGSIAEAAASLYDRSITRTASQYRIYRRTLEQENSNPT